MPCYFVTGLLSGPRQSINEAVLDSVPGQAHYCNSSLVGTQLDCTRSHCLSVNTSEERF